MFIRKQIQRKINKITNYQWKCVYISKQGRPKLASQKAQPVNKERSLSSIPCGFAFINCKLIYWQSRASGELIRAGADPVVTWRVFPVRLSKSVLFISSEKENETSQAITAKPRSSSHSISWQWVFLTTDSTAELFPSLQFLPPERAFLHFEKWNLCRSILFS